jgi:hypothetical protein
LVSCYSEVAEFKVHVLGALFVTVVLTDCLALVGTLGKVSAVGAQEWSQSGGGGGSRGGSVWAWVVRSVRGTGYPREGREVLTASRLTCWRTCIWAQQECTISPKS